jgi:hypothetical protein
MGRAAPAFDRRRGALFYLSLALAAGAVAAAPQGCKSPDDEYVNIQRPVGSGGGGGGGGAGGGANDPEAYFEANVKPGMIDNCAGADCHSSGEVAFLLSGQEYASITSYISRVGLPLVVPEPQKSLLMTYPGDPEHPGNTWEGREELRAAVLSWLGLEAAHNPPVQVFEVGPVDPEGLTVLSLATLGPDYAGMTLSFYAAELGSPVTALGLSNVSVWPSPGRGLRVSDPTFVILPPFGDELFDTSLHGEPYVVVAPDRVELGSGEVVLTSWGDGSQLLVRFRALTPLFADGEQVYLPCNDVASFTTAVDALPLNEAETDPNGFLYCAEQCHGGTTGPAPTQTMNLAGLLEAPRNDELACAIARVFIAPANPAESAIVTVTDPAAGDPHPFAFGGTAASHAAFVQAVTPWIESEGAP